MTNNIRKIKQDLRAYAKRCKDVHYTESLLITFLVTGMLFTANNLFSAPKNTSIESQRQTISTSIKTIHQQVKATRKENEKLLKNTNLELIRLMEQGDHVVKSPWSSWQYGINYFNNNWNGTYKGRGNKQADVKYERAKSKIGGTYEGNKYGVTELAKITEPIASIPLDASVTPKSIYKTAPKFTVSGPAGSLPAFETRTVDAPNAPADIIVNSPTIVTSTVPRFAGAGFPQGADIYVQGMTAAESLPRTMNQNSFISNYKTYNANNFVVGVSGKTMDVNGGNLTVQTDETANAGRNISGIVNTPRTITNGHYTAHFATTHSGMALINDLRDRDSVYHGNYTMNDDGTKGGSINTHIFLSYNPAGVGGMSDAEVHTWTGGMDSHYDGTWTNVERTALLDTDFNLTLNNASQEDAILVGVEHQLWARDETEHHSQNSNKAQSNSYLNNKGTITLNSGKRMVGIMIDTENSQKSATNKTRKAHRTENNGIIKINKGVTESVGMDFGEFENQLLKTDIKIGNINIQGNNNVGYRMQKIFSGTDDYFDYITADGGNGKITVGGNNNIGISIAKDLSNGKDSNNAISNLKNLNVLVDGRNDAGTPVSKNVGFLRTSDSDNNTAPMLLNSTTMGTFEFGSNAFDSTLIRSDAYNVEIQKDITINNGHAKGGNVIGVANDTTSRGSNPSKTNVISTAKLTSNNQYKFRGLLSNGGNASVENKGGIEILGNKDEGIGIAAVNDGDLKTSADIKVTGTGVKKVGVYNGGNEAEISGGTITVSGEDSAGVLNKKKTRFTADTTIEASDGTTGIFSNGNSGNNVAATNSAVVTVKVNDNRTGNTVKRGVGVYATNGSNVTIPNADIDVNGGSSALVATKGSKIDVKSGVVKYKGEGYALYTGNSVTGTGTIDASNSTLTLDGKAVGFEVDGSGGTYHSNVTLSNTTVNINSDDVILMSVVNPYTTKLSDFDSVLNKASGLSSSSITGSTNYKLGVISGLNGSHSFRFDTTLDKKDAVSNAASQSYKYVRNLILQRSILDADSDVKAVLSSAEVTAIKEPTVYGLAISSTKGAVTNAETGININGKTVTADRTDAGSGAIGLYTNFGTVNVNGGGKVNIETDTSNTVNKNGVGVYVVNGSKVNNNGDIEVSGEESIGVLGLSYRQDQAGNVIGNEFGSANEGTVTINNNKNITMNSENAKGIYIKNNSTEAPSTSAPTKVTAPSVNVANNNSGGVITMKGNGTTGNAAVAMYAEGATIKNNAGGKIDLQGTGSQIGMFGVKDKGNQNSVVLNSGTITVGASTGSVPNVGMYSNDADIVPETNGTIDVKDNSYGMYGKSVKMTGGVIKTANNGVGIFATGPSVDLQAGTIQVGQKQSVGVFVADDATSPVTTNVTSNVNMTIDNDSFGYVITATTPGTQLTTGAGTTATLNKDSVYIYQNSNTGKVFNNTKLNSTGGRNYGLYGNGTMENNAVIDFASGKGNVGVYSTGGTATNNSIIRVGETDLSSKEFGIGMATGYYNKNNSSISNQGTVINNGTIEVSKPNSMGMYAVGPNSKAINYGNISLSGSNTVGMYLDQGAKGENWGKIQTTANGLSSVKGIYLAHGSYIKNYGEINIAASDTKSAGIWSDGESADNAEEHAKGVNPSTGTEQTGKSTPAMKIVTATDQKTEGGVTIKVPPAANPVTVRDAKGNILPITGVDTNVPTPTPSKVTVTDPSGVTVIDLSTRKLGNTALGKIPSSAEARAIGMYVDTSGVNYTNPIKGLNNLSGLTDINLYFGPEAARYTTAKVIRVGDNILKPYNRDLSTLVTAGTTLNVTSPSITWMAQPTKDPNGLLDKVYLVKIPYTALAKKGDRNTYNFLDGLEQRYGVEGIGTRENELFQKLNGITEGEGHILAQAVDEMKGHQYANTQQRINATGNTLDKEFIYLRDRWRNPSKQNNKIKIFSQRGEYNTDTAGIKDYRSNAYGIAYVHEDETVKMGHSSGWYAGAVTNRFKFKDLGKSKEDQTMIKAGVFKTISPKGDHNGALRWTVSGDAFYGINSMKRKYWIVDDVFEAKSNYNSYGVALKNELGYDIRMSERTHLRPFGALKMEYGRFSGIKEDNGQMRLEVKGNDYFSVRPEVGMEFKYVQPLAVRTNLTVGLSAAYENEIGKLQKGNKAKVRYTTAGWYNLEKEKKDRRGNGKFDLNIGVDNTRFGVTVNGGYDTKGKNVRAGIGFRAIY
ncbi:autotransporter beta-domain protein [Leptotrichia trevisanii]|uniref:autotransporter-associated N-terminal domain-containing protein n=1 Tax=Leptotrichia trevisanii TaxID=109328 RepID=UPI00118A6CE0|nr:autotransporter-associated N-terminal domain-containing protein [Leptotrichia trevisanii]BBM56910.1 autotransporter beta-domain protein [Leptotrichia trevisanii]